MQLLESALDPRRLARTSGAIEHDIIPSSDTRKQGTLVLSGRINIKVALLGEAGDGAIDSPAARRRRRGVRSTRSLEAVCEIRNQREAPLRRRDHEIK